MIVAEEVSKYYGERRALDQVSFKIGAGEVAGFLGLNGAGKTTLLKILCGLLLPSSGRVRIDGIDVLDQPREVRRRIGFLPEQPPIYGDMTVRQMLGYAGRLNGLTGGEIGRRIDEVIAATELTSVADDLVAWLSQGYRQRLGIAQAIVHRPALVILDEPITGLDPKQIVGMRGLIRGLAEHHTVLVSSHILGEIHQTCDRILVLHQGRLIAQGTEAELTTQATGQVQVVARGAAELVQQTALKTKGVSRAEVEQTDDEVVTLLAEVDGLGGREALVSALVGAGVGVRRVAEVEAGLEAIFLRLTGSSAARSSAG
ncbi:MAG: ABC transporter ATP-binding protein [Deltaproteobacteria bacterium]|nr:ABC transporter ATP-binding protein [Deltaproteobacteria bacterium]